GPTEVRKEILDEMSKPIIGHRTEEFKQLFAGIKPKLRKLFFTENDVLISTSSGSGFMEGAIRNCVEKKVLNCVCGAFSQKWYNIAVACGKECEKIEFEYGNPVDISIIDKKLSSGDFDSVCITHCETSTGVLNPLDKISKVVKKYPDVLFLVDAVSSLGGEKIEVDKLGIDMCLTCSQKAIVLPPGISFASVSQKVYERAKTIKSKGYYFNLLELKKNYDKNQTLYTPSISHLYALDKQLNYIINEEGLENKFNRHRQMAILVRKWIDNKNMKMFPKKGYESNTVSCAVNTKNINMKKVKQEMGEKGYLIDSGYKKLNEKLAAEGKHQTFRIAHMGDTQIKDIELFLNELDNFF
ncbi:MAG: alanine--glyoxylate aminotransferase family protein, partial [Candidatus Aenigmarchaeota archaeon]|nr:alanine--glyoxylate aminotransferase family protein [Candidatus Aenigmarchaeota archaeon]